MFSARPAIAGRHQRRTPALARRTAALAVTTVVASGVLAALAAPVFAVAPRVPTKLPAAIESLSPYQPQSTCAPIARPGVIKFRSLVLATYRGTGDSGIVRACSSGGRSEHKEGRAWDWRVSVKSPTQVKQVNALFAWLFATDAHGNRYAMARRLGIMYIIWNKHIWGAYAASSGWRNYSCSGVTGCHQDHVHFSFNWAGAKAQTSFWTKKVANVGTGTGGGTSGSIGGDGNGGYGGYTGGQSGSPTTLPPGAPPLLSDQRLPRAIAVSPTVDRVTSSFSLTGGHHYLLTVTGTYTYRTARDGTPVLADAGCSQDRQWTDGQVTTTWTPTVPEAGQWANVVYRLAVGHDHTDWQPVTADATGCDTATHTYRMTYTPSYSGPLHFSVLDYDRSDDAGKLVVTVTRAAG